MYSWESTNKGLNGTVENLQLQGLNGTIVNRQVKRGGGGAVVNQTKELTIDNYKL